MIYVLHQEDKVPNRIQSKKSCLRRIFFDKFCLRRSLFTKRSSRLEIGKDTQGPPVRSDDVPLF